MKNLKIAFSGPSGSGKTTLKNKLLNSDINNLNFKTTLSPARSVIESYPNSDTFFIHEKIIQFKESFELPLFNNSKNFIVDRCYTDSYQYLIKSLNGLEITNNIIYLNEFLNKCLTMDKKYDYIFILNPFTKNVKCDNIRTEMFLDSMYQNSFLENLKLIFNENNIDFNEIIEKNIDKRVQEFYEKIKF